MAITYSNHFQSFGGRNLQLNIIEYNPDSFEVQVINKNYKNERSFRIKSVITLAIIYSAYIVSIPRRIFLLDGICLLSLAILIYTTFELVKSEKVLFISQFALQISTEKFLSRKSSSFIPATNIKDVVINEVIHDLAIKHILIVRTKGNLCHTRPIITIFKSLQPRIECLEVIYSLFIQKLDAMQ